MPTFLSFDFWFTLRTLEMTFSVGAAFLVVFVVLTVAGFVLRTLANKKGEDVYKRQTLHRVAMLCLTMGIIGLFLAFFSYERVRLLGSRFWFPLWTLATILWALAIAKFAVKKIPAMRAEAVAKIEREKYLPRKK